MAYTAEQLDKLIAIRASGQLRVQFGDRLIQYQSGADLDAAIAQAKRDLASATGTPTRRYAEHGRGY
jgi:hypothetical protein